MPQTLTRNWLLLALCGVLDAIISVIYLIMWNTDGPITFHSWNGTIVLLGKLALAAGAGTAAAGLLRSSSGKCWPLVLNGFALGALGLIQYDLAARFPISFLTVALLVILMAMSMGILELTLAGIMRRERHPVDGWLLTLAGMASFGFALVFISLGLHWIQMAPGSHTDLFWLGCHFGFSAICMLALALRLRSQGLFPSGRTDALFPFGKPSHAH